MTTTEVKHDLEQRLDQLHAVGNQVAETYDIPAISEFKSRLKFLRLFCEFIRVQTNNRHIRLPGSYKQLYNISGAMLENAKSEDSVDGVPEKLKSEWEKYYSGNQIEKLKKVFSEQELRDIQPELFDNFYRNHDMQKESITSLR